MLAETLLDVCARLQIEDWDLLLIGDGSGSMWGYPIGWACIAIEKGSWDRKAFYGCMNEGTVNVAELMAYLAPLSWYSAKVDKAEGSVGRRGIKHVHILTDSSYARDVGNSGGSVQMTRNTVLWAGYALLERQGFKLHWHFIPREDVALNLWADEVSKAARRLILEADGIADCQDVSKLNPW